MTSGIEGKVTIGPGGPAIQGGGPDAGKPYAAEIVIRESAGNRQVAVVNATADGAFKVELPEGEYSLEPRSPAPFVPPYAESQQVTVRKDQFTKVNIVYDSGIR